MRTKSPLQSEKILEVATRLFGHRRFDEVRMEDIACEAEVGKGTLYRYFSDKEELYMALLARASEQFMLHIEEVSSLKLRPRQKLEALVTAIFEQFDDQPLLLDLIQRAEVIHGSGPEFPWQKTRQRMPQIVHQLFEEGQAQGEFSIRDHHLTALMLLGGLRSVIRFGEKPRPKDLAHRIVADMLAGAQQSSSRKANAAVPALA